MPRLLYPGFHDARTSLGLLALRCVAGAAFILHGWTKIQPDPMAWMPPDSGIPGIMQLAAAVAEFGGGIAWILGALTPLFSVLLAVTMAVATNMHLSMGDPFVAHGGRSFQPALGYLAVAILLLLAGPGRFSVDYCLFGRRVSGMTGT